MAEFKFLEKFDKSKLAELSRSKGEPEWAVKKREEAFAQFLSQSWPSKGEEEWRRTDFNRLETFDFSPDWSLAGPSQLITNGQKSNGYASKLEQFDSPQVKLSTAGEFPREVIFTDLESAVQKYPELVQKCSGLIRAEENRLVAFNQAFRNRGIFLYVPKNTELTLPFYSHLHLEGGGWGVFPHSLLVIEENSKVVLVDDFSSENHDQESFSNALSEIYLKPNSHLTYINLQRWGEKVHHFFRQRVKLEGNAHLTALSVNLGSKVVRSDIETVLAGPGAFSYMFGLALANKSQYFEQHTRQTHVAPQTTSDLLFKTALFDQSRSVFSGLIQIAKEAQKSDAYQANRNLLLSDQARVDTLPKLEILANDVRCTHGATVGPVDLDQLFYLVSRGISERDAKTLIVGGFFDEVLGKISSNLSSSLSSGVSSADFLQGIREHVIQKILQ